MAADPFYQMASTTLGSSVAYSSDNGQYDVDVLQLWDSDHDAVQNQLVYIGVPDTASTFGLLAVGCAGLVLLARRIEQYQSVAVLVKTMG